MVDIDDSDGTVAAVISHHGDALDDTGVVDQNVDVADFLVICLTVHGRVLVGNIATIAIGSTASLFVSGQTFINSSCLISLKTMVAPQFAIAVAIAKPMP